MHSNTKEIALEQAIETHLTGNGYRVGNPADFDATLALDTRLFWEFLEATQSESLEKLRTRYPADWQARVESQLDRNLKRHGLLPLLKKGLSLEDVHFHLMYPAPLASSAQKVHENFIANIWSLTRQVHHSQANPHESVDVVLFLNGLPLLTLELKNAWTGQSARFHGQKQYRERDVSQTLLHFGRVLVHLAADTDEVWMTTKLAGGSTFFLPFNKGHNHGAGNPPNPHGHKTAYLWEEVLLPASLAGIIEHFVLLEGERNAALSQKTLIFPRYHQLDVVRRLLADATMRGVGQRYLIQHSAGSGKSNSITWAAYQLIAAYPASQGVAGTRPLDAPIFDSVIVVTDRRLLDRQLRDNIRDFSEVKNIVAAAHSSADLKAALENGKKIIITTIQKFPFIVDGIADMSDKRFAVIIDEAHSGQSGSAHDTMNRAMGTNEDLDTEDAQDKILAAMQTRKMRGNASYFAFTATPKNITLEKFGEKQADGSFKPFHLYSMKQAIEEGFILDVLANYTTYKSYYEIRKSIEDNPLFDTVKAQKKLRAYVERSRQTIATKAEVMVDHFLNRVVNSKKLRGQARGMIVTQSIESAIRYYHAVRNEMEKRGNPHRVLIAFSGEKMVDGITYSEAGINGFPEDKTRFYFDGHDEHGQPFRKNGRNIENEYRLLIVANKYLTGFDQPKLCAMYVDKNLQGVQAVQALSRLNRASAKLGKRTEDLFVLDFFNTAAEIKEAFDPFYTSTTLSEATDVNVLHELKDMLDNFEVYEWAQVEEFCVLFFSGADAQQLSPLIDTAVARFHNHPEWKDRIDFKIKAKQFVKIYGQIAAIMSFEMVAWEKLFWFLKFLVPKLKINEPSEDALDDLLEAVDLTSYGLERTRIQSPIVLDAGESALEPQNPNPRTAHVTDALDPLEEIIHNFNERWFHGWNTTPEEQRIKFMNIVASVRNHKDFEEKFYHNSDTYGRDLAFSKIMEDVMLSRRRNELELYKLHAQDEAFRAAFYHSIQQALKRTGTCG